MEKFDHWLFKSYILMQRFINRLTFKKLKTKSGDIAYLEGGSGSTLLLLHGFGDNKDSWTQLTGFLTKHYNVIALDIPGFGDSYHPEADFAVLQQAKRINEFVSAKKLTTFTLVGSSYGGYLSAIYADIFPEKINGLFLISPLGVQRSEQSNVFKDIVDGQHPKLLPNTVDDFHYLLGLCFNKPPYIPKFVLRQLSYSARENSLIREHIFFATHRLGDDQIEFDIPLESILESISVPTFVVWGDCDNILSIKGADAIAGLKNAAIVTEKLNFIGHLPQLECPNKLANHFINFASAQNI
jgi:pimeloyl-ACP methyl ester carboxylesterase